MGTCDRARASHGLIARSGELSRWEPRRRCQCSCNTQATADRPWPSTTTPSRPTSPNMAGARITRDYAGQRISMRTCNARYSADSDVDGPGGHASTPPRSPSSAQRRAVAVSARLPTRTAAVCVVIRRSSCRWPLSAVPATARWAVSQPYIYTSPRWRQTARSWHPFMSRPGLGQRLRLWSGGPGTWLVRRAGVRGQGRPR